MHDDEGMTRKKEEKKEKKFPPANVPGFLPTVQS